jgi:hypothetical protein
MRLAPQGQRRWPVAFVAGVRHQRPDTLAARRPQLEMRDARSWRCATPVGVHDARVRDACRMRGCATPAGCAIARCPSDSSMSDACLLRWPEAPGWMRSPEGWQTRPRTEIIGAGQQDHASDDRHVHATEAGEQPRFTSNRARSRPRPCRSRLMVKDVGQPPRSCS